LLLSDDEDGDEVLLLKLTLPDAVATAVCVDVVDDDEDDDDDDDDDAPAAARLVAAVVVLVEELPFGDDAELIAIDADLNEEKYGDEFNGDDDMAFF
jgi:hypothetical protein